MKRSIFWRTFGGYIAVGFLTVLLFAFYTFSTLRQRSTADLTRLLESAKGRMAAVAVRATLSRSWLRSAVERWRRVERV